MTTPLPALALALTLTLFGCNARDATIRVVDESGSPLASAWAMLDGERIDADDEGEIRLRKLTRPAAVVLRAKDSIPEPLVLGASDLGSVVTVPLLDDALGLRTVIHFTGDVMIGRRYQDPSEGRPLVPANDPRAAERLVRDAAPFLALADVTMVNLESVVGEAPDDEAYPGKRWLLQTPPEALAALDSLGVDLVVLANNHQRDWLDDGVAGTLDALDAVALPRTGAGMTEADAGVGHVITVGNGVSVGTLSWTSVDGDFVNDAYPDDTTPMPADVEDEDRWLWDTRSWGAPDLGVEVASRRIGGAWATLEALERSLEADDAAALWSSASDVYPELQDWVARRGHAGAARWDEATSVAAIGEMRPEVDLLVVELHMGFQFASAPGAGSRAAARAAIDAGADIVVCHHPHVLQGVEWYNGKLIAYSLGNFIFDQDFLSTFQSAFLRTVWDADGELVQARLVPMLLDAYRPVPSTDALADQTLRSLWEGSLLGATAGRGADLGVRAVVDDTVPSDVRFVLEHHTARIEQGLPQERSATIDVPCDAVAEAPRDALVRVPVAGGAGFELGRGLDVFGQFEDMDGDTDDGDVPGWTWTSPDIEVVGGLFGRDHALALRRDRANEERVSARMTARIPLPAHRVWADRDGEQALDGDASYSVVLRADRRGASALGSVRLAMYHFDDLNPTEEPVSALLREVELPFTPTRGEETVVLDLPRSAFAPVDGVVPNAVLLYVALHPPNTGGTELRVWDVSLVEWRGASGGYEGFVAADWVRGCGKVTLGTVSM